MPNRDYAVRSKSKKGGNKVLILAIIILLLMGSGLALWLLKESSPPMVVPTQTVETQQQPKSSLPTPPEEVYSYIRDLETREVPVDKNSKLAQLTKEQEQAIQKQKEEQLRLEQVAQTAQSTQQTTQTATENHGTTKTEKTVEEQKPQVVALTPEELAEKREIEQKLAEEKRKQAELKKQQEAAKKAEQAKTEQAKAESAKETAPAKQETAKIVATAKPASEAPKAAGKFGLQCGAFKNKAQAENMQARLAMAGYNARIASNGEWNRVFVGPVGDRAAASSAQSNARSVAECLIIAM